MCYANDVDVDAYITWKTILLVKCTSIRFNLLANMLSRFCVLYKIQKSFNYGDLLRNGADVICSIVNVNIYCSQINICGFFRYSGCKQPIRNNCYMLI